MSTQTPPATTRWQTRTYRRYPTLYLDATAGLGVTDAGLPFTHPPQASLIEIIAALPADIARIYLCGQLPSAPQVSTQHGGQYSPFNSWVLEAQPEQVYLDSGTEHDATFARLGRPSGGRPVELRTIAGWLGTNACTPHEAHAALALVAREVRRLHGWDGPEHLLATPAETGLDLWRRTIGYGKEYPILPEELRTLIHRTSGQGRFELLPPSSADGLLPAITCLDARWMYAAPCLDELGIGPAVQDDLPDYAGFRPARYRVRFRVPAGWAHVGVLVAPALGKDGQRTWFFPRKPGETGDTWADGTELRIAFWPLPHVCPTCQVGYRANSGTPCPQHGWPVQILERVLFTKGRPLATWAQKLIALRETVGRDAPTTRIGDLARAAVRNLLIHAIGSFHGTHRPITHVAGEDDPAAIPERTRLDLALTAEGETLYSWEEQRRTPARLDYDRPEWSAQVWARARSRLLLHRDVAGTFTGALTLPYAHIVGMRLDALYVTHDPNWPDNGNVGVFRQKWSSPRLAPWPQHETDLTALHHRPDVHEVEARHR
jgi:hypothetical protein